MHFQEVHGGDSDIDAFHTALPHHRLFGSFAPSPGAGGLLFALGPTCKFDAEMVEVVPGRLAFLHLHNNIQEYVIINVHLCPGLGRAAALAQLRRLRSRLRRHTHALQIFIGDFNFVDPAEGRLHVPSGTLSLRHDLYYSVWHDTFPHLCEVVQPAHTRRKMHDGCVSVLSRLDKVFTNLPDADLQMAATSCGILWSASYDQKGSDQVAIRLSLGQGTRPRRNPFPRWVIEHLLFQSALRHKLDAMDIHKNVDFTRQDFKGLAADTAVATRRILCGRLATTSLEQLHWATLALRGVLCGSWDLVDLARPRWPPIGHAYSRHGRSEPFVDALRSMVRTLSQTQLDHEIEDLEEEISDLTRALDAAKVEAARRQLACARASRERWGSTRRRLVLSAVLYPSGAAAEDDSQAADLLYRHWSAVAAATDVNVSRYRDFQPFIQKCPAINWTISLESFSALLTSRKNSAPGPDGLPIGVWRDAGPSAVLLLYRAYLDVLASGYCPSDFWGSLSVFIPMGNDASDAGEAAATPEDLRPICLTNTDAKLIIAALAAPLEEASRVLLHPAQACVKGRNMVDNILGA